MERELRGLELLWSCLSARGRWRGGYQAGVSASSAVLGRGVGVGDIPGEAARVAGVGGGTSPEAYAPIF